MTYSHRRLDRGSVSLEEMVYKLQLGQSVVAQVLNEGWRFDSFGASGWPKRAQNKWLPNSFQAQINVLILVFKALYGLGSGCL